jgi:hypothetical protein
MTSLTPPPAGAVLVGYIDRHPADKSGLGYAVIFFPATGIEMAWDGQAVRSLPNNWRKKVTFTTANQAAELGRKGGQATSDAKADAARANGAKGGRPRKHPKKQA